MGWIRGILVGACAWAATFVASPAAFGQSSASLADLIAAYRALPREERDLAEALAKELLQAERPALDRVFAGARPGEARAFAQALAGNGELSSLEALLRSFDAHEVTHVRLLHEIAERAAQKPQLLRRIGARLEALQERLRQTRPTAPSIGGRVLNSGLFIMGLVGALYSFEASFIDQANRPLFASSLYFLPSFLCFHFLIAVWSEAIAIKHGVRSYFAEWREIRRARRMAADLSALIKEMADSAQGQEVLAAFGYFATGQADRDARAAIPEMGAYVAQMASDPRIMDRVATFTSLPNFLALVRRLQERLTPSELQELRVAIQKVAAGADGLELSPGPAEELAHFERSVWRQYAAFAGEAESPEAAYKDALAETMRRIHEQRGQGAAGTAPTAFNAVALVSLSIGVSILGLQASVGASPTPLDSLFPERWVTWFRAHPAEILQFGGLFTLPSVYNFFFKTMPTLRANFRWPDRPSLVERFRIIRNVLESARSEPAAGGRASTGAPVPGQMPARLAAPTEQSLLSRLLGPRYWRAPGEMPVELGGEPVAGPRGLACPGVVGGRAVGH